VQKLDSPDLHAVQCTSDNLHKTSAGCHGSSLALQSMGIRFQAVSPLSEPTDNQTCSTYTEYQLELQYCLWPYKLLPHDLVTSVFSVIDAMPSERLFTLSHIRCIWTSLFKHFAQHQHHYSFVSLFSKQSGT